MRSPRTEEENDLVLKHIERIHAESRGTYGWPRVHAELTLGLGVVVNHKRVARLMREAGIHGLYCVAVAAAPRVTTKPSPTSTWSTGTSSWRAWTRSGVPTSPNTPRLAFQRSSQRDLSARQ